jgi:hypothetical protein
MPESSIIPFNVECIVSCLCPEGHYVGDMKFDVEACLTVILKVVVEVDLLIPTYGYSAIPPCQEFSQEACSGFFELPLFPQ